MTTPKSNETKEQQPLRTAPGVPRRLTSEELIGPHNEVLIRHAGSDYRLRITRHGKLILTK